MYTIRINAPNNSCTETNRLKTICGCRNCVTMKSSSTGSHNEEILFVKPYQSLMLVLSLLLLQWCYPIDYTSFTLPVVVSAFPIVYQNTKIIPFTKSNKHVASTVRRQQQQKFVDRQNDHSVAKTESVSFMRNVEEDQSTTRRNWLATIADSIVFSIGIVSSITSTTASAAETVAVEMKTFVDPQGLFIITIPQRFFAIRRTNQGDLPNSATGSGRRGSSIFNAGDLAKAEVLAIERYPTRVLLEEYGIEPTGSLKSFPDIGEVSVIANLIVLRRDRERPVASSSSGGGTELSKSRLVPGSLSLSSDGSELSFNLLTNIDVQKPELLMEQSGISVLNRITAAKATLRSNDGYIMAVFASALEMDWQGPDGKALQDSVNSFQVIDQKNNMAKN